MTITLQSLAKCLKVNKVFKIRVLGSKMQYKVVGKNPGHCRKKTLSQNQLQEKITIDILQKFLLGLQKLFHRHL